MKARCYQQPAKTATNWGFGYWANLLRQIYSALASRRAAQLEMPCSRSPATLNVYTGTPRVAGSLGRGGSSRGAQPRGEGWVSLARNLTQYRNFVGGDGPHPIWLMALKKSLLVLVNLTLSSRSSMASTGFSWVRALRSSQTFWSSSFSRSSSSLRVPVCSILMVGK